MALVSGMPREEVRRSILRGHPQLTIADLLGSPLPSDMMKAEDMSQIKIAWRKWIGERVKIVDEYNRIPTKTQSALLSLMAEGYAEMFDQYVYAGRSSWFLTANDDAGGGTFQVIEALEDRIDVVVRAVPFNSGFVETLLRRIEADRLPEDLVPSEIVFSAAELEAVYQAILSVQVPPPVLDRLAFFLGQLDFCRMASPQFEHKSKDTLKLAGVSVASVCNDQCPWTRRSTSAPKPKWASRRALLQDRVAWIRNMVDMSLADFERHAPLRSQVVELRQELDQGLAGVDLKSVERRLGKISALMRKLMKDAELSGPVYEDLIHLKSMHSRYQNYAHWLRESRPGRDR
jgi:MoxR-like ATPase